MKRTALLAILAFVVLGGPQPPALHAQAAPAKRPITHDVYDAWQSIQGTKLSADGVWLAYALTPQDGDGELVVRNLKTNAEIRAARPRAAHHADGRFAVFRGRQEGRGSGAQGEEEAEDMPKVSRIVNLHRSGDDGGRAREELPVPDDGRRRWWYPTAPIRRRRRPADRPRAENAREERDRTDP
jgi:hypothetical protein